jgi:hypothetical protein
MSGSDDIDQLTVTEMNYILVAENAILLLFAKVLEPRQNIVKISTS